MSTLEAKKTILEAKKAVLEATRPILEAKRRGIMDPSGTRKAFSEARIRQNLAWSLE